MVHLAALGVGLALGIWAGRKSNIVNTVIDVVDFTGKKTREARKLARQLVADCEARIDAARAKKRSRNGRRRNQEQENNHAPDQPVDQS